MKKGGLLLLSAALLVLSACGGAGASTKAANAGGASVTQIMENAARDTSSAAPETPTTDGEAAPAADWEADAAEPSPEAAQSADGVDVELTQMNATMVFAEVSNIMFDPDPYVGKIIRMTGMAVSSTDADSGVTYHAVIIQDATACCASGIEYVLAQGDYPPDEAEATVTGEFELYEEGDVVFCRLKDAALDA